MSEFPGQRPSIDEVLLHVAYAIAARSTCPYNHVGAIVALHGRVLTTGYNGAPAGMQHCTHGPRVEGKAIVPCVNAVHAEMNAIAFAARHGVSLDGGTMYTTLSPCRTCAQLIINAGILTVVFGEMYRDSAGLDLLSAAKVGYMILDGSVST